MVWGMPLVLRQGFMPEGTRPACLLRGLIACDESLAGTAGPPGVARKHENANIIAIAPRNPKIEIAYERNTIEVRQ